MTFLQSTRTSALVAMMFATVIGGHAHYAHMQIQDVTARGTLYEAEITGGTVKTGKRSGTALNLAWIDSSGHKQSVRGLGITTALASQIVADTTLRIDTIAIKAVTGEVGRDPIIVADVAGKLSSYAAQREVGSLIAGLAGLVALMTLLLGRRRRAPVVA
jgi:hypothetical protein